MCHQTPRSPRAEPCQPGLHRRGHRGLAGIGTWRLPAWHLPGQRRASPARSGAPALAAYHPAGPGRCRPRGCPAGPAAPGCSRHPAPPRRAGDLWGTEMGAARGGHRVPIGMGPGSPSPPHAPPGPLCAVTQRGAMELTGARTARCWLSPHCSRSGQSRELPAQPPPPWGHRPPPPPQVVAVGDLQPAATAGAGVHVGHLASPGAAGTPKAMQDASPAPLPPCQAPNPPGCGSANTQMTGAASGRQAGARCQPLWHPGDGPAWLHPPPYKPTPKVKRPRRVFQNINLGGKISMRWVGCAQVRRWHHPCCPNATLEQAPRDPHSPASCWRGASRASPKFKPFSEKWATQATS